MARMTDADKDALIRGVELLAAHGRDAADIITDALARGDLERWEVEEAFAQLEDV